MRSCVPALSAVLLGLLVSSGAALSVEPSAEVPWRDEVDIEAALEEAAMDGKRVMVYVTASWCGPCKKLSEEVFETSYGDSLARSFVAVRVDADTDVGREVRKRYKVERLPTVFVLRPDGVEVGRLVGYAGAERFKQTLDRLRTDEDDGGGLPFEPTFGATPGPRP